MDLSFLKNPIILAIIAASLTYLYMYWENKQKQEKNPKAEIEEVSYTTPAIVGILTLFITYSFFYNQEPNSEVTSVIEQTKQPQLQPPLVQHGGAKLLEGGLSVCKSKMSERLTDSFGSNTYHLVGKNAIRLPQTDVFIDIAKF